MDVTGYAAGGTGAASRRNAAYRAADSNRRIVAAIRRWREHAGSQQQLRAFDDRLLRDIGLRREDLGYEFPKPFRHWD
jgi:uncharacterized protein YjiS (DUF1127 family)